jgi:hypothetical protein
MQNARGKVSRGEALWRLRGLASYELHVIASAYKFGRDSVAVELHDSGSRDDRTVGQDVVNVLSIRNGEVANVDEPRRLLLVRCLLRLSRSKGVLAQALMGLIVAERSHALVARGATRAHTNVDRTVDASNRWSASRVNRFSTSVPCLSCTVSSQFGNSDTVTWWWTMLFNSSTS